MSSSIKFIPKPWLESKIWGVTSRIIHGHAFEVHALRIHEGGYCSRHRHKKWNHFYVQEGEIVVELFGRGERPVDEPEEGLVLKAGDVMQVAPQTWHRFTGREDAQVIETYWVDHIDFEDIERADVGGLVHTGGLGQPSSVESLEAGGLPT